MPLSEFEERQKKLEQIKAEGINPYPERYERTHLTSDALKEGEKGTRETEEIIKKPNPAISLAGRLVAFREHGKLTFGHLMDDSGKIQICFMKDILGQDKYKFLKKIDIGDFLGVKGELFKTKHGEITLLVAEYTLLAKTLRPLPEKWHGLKDQEDKYRYRYLDTIMDPESKKRFVFRSNLIKQMRMFLEDNGFIEVETPILSSTASGATAKPFKTHHEALDQEFYLRIAPETYLKRAVAGGFERVFEFAKCFRNEGMDPSHLQEFTMVEYYASYWNYEDNMAFTERFLSEIIKKLCGTLKITYQGTEIDFKTPWPRINYRDLILKDSKIDIYKFNDKESLIKEIKNKKIDIEDIEKYGFGNLIDALYKKVSRPKLINPCFVVNHPVNTKPLARKNDKNPLIADSFQLLVNTWEIVNAYSEIVDPVDQRKRLEAQSKMKAEGDEEAMMMDEDFLLAMEHGMPPMSGWGLGIDRFVSLLTDQLNLKDTVLFPLLRPESNSQEPGDPSIIPARPAGTTLGVKTRIINPIISSGAAAGSEVEKSTSFNLSRSEAFSLVKKHIKEHANLNHLLESEAIMRALAKKLNEDEELWGITGLLHDLDWEETINDPKKHGIKTSEYLKQLNLPEDLIYAILSHNNEYLDNAYPPKSKLDYALCCSETLTGLIYASTLVRPDKKVVNVEVKSIKKKFKDKSFAANCRREIILECEKLGLTLDEFIAVGLEGFKTIADKIGL